MIIHTYECLSINWPSTLSVLTSYITALNSEASKTCLQRHKIGRSCLSFPPWAMRVVINGVFTITQFLCVDNQLSDLIQEYQALIYPICPQGVIIHQFLPILHGILISIRILQSSILSPPFSAARPRLRVLQGQISLFVKKRSWVLRQGSRLRDVFGHPDSKYYEARPDDSFASFWTGSRGTMISIKALLSALSLDGH